MDHVRWPTVMGSWDGPRSVHFNISWPPSLGPPILELIWNFIFKKFYLGTSFTKIFLFILVDGVYRRFQNRFLNSFLSIFCSPIKILLFWKLVFRFALLKDNFVQSPAQVQYWSKDFCILISATAILLLGRHPKNKVE